MDGSNFIFDYPISFTQILNMVLSLYLPIEYTNGNNAMMMDSWNGYMDYDNSKCNIGYGSTIGNGIDYRIQGGFYLLLGY